MEIVGFLLHGNDYRTTLYSYVHLESFSRQVPSLKRKIPV